VVRLGRFIYLDVAGFGLILGLRLGLGGVVIGMKMPATKANNNNGPV